MWPSIRFLACRLKSLGSIAVGAKSASPARPLSHAITAHDAGELTIRRQTRIRFLAMMLNDLIRPHHSMPIIRMLPLLKDQAGAAWAGLRPKTRRHLDHLWAAQPGIAVYHLMNILSRLHGSRRLGLPHCPEHMGTRPIRWRAQRRIRKPNLGVARSP